MVHSQQRSRAIKAMPFRLKNTTLRNTRSSKKRAAPRESLNLQKTCKERNSSKLKLIFKNNLHYSI